MRGFGLGLVSAANSEYHLFKIVFDNNVDIMKFYTFYYRIVLIYVLYLHLYTLYLTATI